MAFQLKDNKAVFSEINVTPLVDVMLVLLVIFMITAPLMLNGIKLKLPQTKEVNSINLNTSQVILSITKSGNLYLGKGKILKDQLVHEIKNKMKVSASKTLFLRADYEINYGVVAKLMSFLKRGGVSSIALVTEIEKKRKK